VERFVIATIIGLVAALATRPASAQLVPPPDPVTLDPTLHLEVHGAAVLPIARENVCPQGYGCVLGAGFAAGAFVEHRSADGLGLLVGYQVWLLDTSGLYEVGAVHTLRLGLRWVIDTRSRIHPFLEVLAGALIVTDPGTAVTGGGLLSLGVGAEIELTETVAVTVALDGWALAMGAFRTRDGADRAANFGVDVVSQLRVGATILLADSL
jgi:hypothetical protein